MSLSLGEAWERVRAARLADEVERLTRELAAEKAALAETADRFGVECAEHDQELEAADAKLAERTRERDDARRRYCCRLADDRRAKHVREGNGDSRESVASNLGWGYLYTEEPKP